MIQKKDIPNTITLGNVACGWIGLIFAFERSYLIAFGCILLGGVFDFFDGFFARKLNADSGRTGENLDSLADLFTFGITPSIMLFGILRETLGECPPGCPRQYYIYAPVLIVLASALRLAKFDISETDKRYFSGVATPFNGIILALWAVFVAEDTASFQWWFEATIILIFVQTSLLNSNLKTLSAKTKTSLIINVAVLVIGAISVLFFGAFGVLVYAFLYYLASWGYVRFAIQNI